MTIDHACFACGRVHADAREMRTHDGRVVSSYSEEWRHECEAREILNMPSRGRRRLFLVKLEEKRGKTVADALRATVTSMWNARQAMLDDARNQVDAVKAAR